MAIVRGPRPACPSPNATEEPILGGDGRRSSPPTRIGIDMGGTFVDVVVRAGDRVVASGKAAATAGDPVPGILAALAAAAADAAIDERVLLASASDVVHGTTVGINALLTRSGSRVGLLTTRGHEDAILIGRVHQKIAGLGPDALTRVSELRKPEPLVPRWLIRGIHERTDAAGREMVPLDEQGVLLAVEELVHAGCRALAVSFLWSFRDPRHEQRAARLIGRRFPELPVTLSSDVAPVLGEYERTATSVVNAYLLGTVGAYLGRLEAALRERGLRGSLSVMLSGGGAVPARAVMARPVETLGSGPVGGVVAGARVAGELGAGRVIAADMGGTSFDVSLIVDGSAELSDTTVVGQLHLAVPAVEVRSIGAGGGSVAWLDHDGGLHVGPRAAAPGVGPACYGLGGTDATVTDADLVLGRLDPDARLGGRIRPDRAAGELVVGRLAARLGVTTVEAAAGIVRIADAQMADLIRRMTIERGHDPRRFTLLAFGGAGPLHAGGFASDLGIGEIVVPALAGVLSADGLALAAWRRTFLRSVVMAVPLDAPGVAHEIAALEARARREYGASGQEGPLHLDTGMDLRYRRQTHHLTVPLGARIDAAQMDAVVERFERRYEEIHGPGTGYRAAGIEAIAVRLVATGPAHPGASRVVDARDGGLEGGERAPATERRRDVWFDGAFRATPVFAGRALRQRDTVRGPAVVDWPTTTLVVHPGMLARADAWGHVRLHRDDG